MIDCLDLGGQSPIKRRLLASETLYEPALEKDGVRYYPHVTRLNPYF